MGLYDNEVLAALPGTRAELQRALGLGESTVWRIVKRLHEAGKVRISRWVRGGPRGKPVPVYARGNKPDAVCDVVIPPRAERDRQYRLRRRNSGRMEDYRARNRARYWRSKPVFRDPLTAALFGEKGTP